MRFDVFYLNIHFLAYDEGRVYDIQPLNGKFHFSNEAIDPVNYA